jgi:hypothetical protein
MAENKPEGPAGDRKRENLKKFPKFREKLKNMIKSSLEKKKTEKAKAKKKFQKKVLQSGCFGTNDEPGVYCDDEN